MSRVFVGFVRNVNFLLERSTLTARIPMPVEGRWDIRSAVRDPMSGDMVVKFKPAQNPLVESESPRRMPMTAEELRRQLGG